MRFPRLVVPTIPYEEDCPLKLRSIRLRNRRFVKSVNGKQLQADNAVLFY